MKMEKKASPKTLFGFCAVVAGSLLFPNGLSVLHSSFVLGQGLNWTHFIMPTVAGLVFACVLVLLGVLLEKITRMNRDINLFTCMVVHDLKTSASSIFSLVELIRQRRSVPSDHKWIDLIQATSKDILESIQEILALTKHNAKGSASLKKERITGNPYKAMRECIELFAARAQQKGILVLQQIPERLPAVRYHRESLKDVLSNLLSNAIKYSRPSSRVTISSEVLQKEGFLQVMVEDTGPGLSASDLESAFKKFQVLSSKPMAEAESASGLGLWIVKKLTQEMGGEVEVRSEGKNRGSVFSFTLPLASSG